MHLDGLPIEVLSLILSEVKRASFQNLCDLRLVCPILATAIEPLAFSCVKIAPSHSSTFVPQVQHLASGKTPNSRWTTRLEIDQGGHRLGRRMPSRKDRPDIKPPELDNYLVLAIEALRSVKRAEYGLYPTHPYDGALRALYRLPALAELKITFHPGGSTFINVSLPSYSFPNLRVLELEGIRLVPSIVDSLKTLLEINGTLLDALRLQPSVWHDGCMDYQEVAVIALEELLPPCLPRLTSLAINADRFSIPASSVTIFPSISRLDIDNAASGTVNSGLWVALSDAGIQLERLSVYPLTAPTLQYLQSYSGLKELRLCEPSYAVKGRKPLKDRESGKVFGQVLAKHKGTLRHLAFEGVGWKEYGVTEGRLQGILTCKELETLWLVYHFPSNSKDEDEPNDEGEEEEDNVDGEEVVVEDRETDGLSTNMDMTLLISTLATTLPHLKGLTLEAKRRIPNLGWCGNAYQGYNEDMVSAFVEMVRKAKASANAVEQGDVDGIEDERGRLSRCRFEIECRPLYGWRSTSRRNIV